MSILFIDTHLSKTFYVGYLRNDKFDFLQGEDSSIELIKIIDKLSSGEISEIIFIKGPGSLTNLRIGAATAFGIAAGNLTIRVKALNVWDLLDDVETYFYTGTKKWIKSSVNHSVKEILEIAEMKLPVCNWCSNRSDLLPFNQTLNLPYPNLIKKMPQNLNKTTDNVELIYYINNFSTIK